jgi:hypothetical protein
MFDDEAYCSRCWCAMPATGFQLTIDGQRICLACLERLARKSRDEALERDNGGR